MIGQSRTQRTATVLDLVERSTAIFFDFDGVLADSVHVKTWAFGELFAHHGKDIKARVVAHHLANGGMSRFDKFKHYYSKYLNLPLTQKKMNDLCDKFAQLVVDRVVNSAGLPGADSFLYNMTKTRRLFVISATPEEEIREIIRRREMSDKFVGVFGSPEGKGKHVARLLGEYGLEPGQCVFFGDATSDYDAAMSNAVPFVGVISASDSVLLARYPDIVWISDFLVLI